MDRVQVQLADADRTGARTQRTIHPLGLVDKGGAWYLLADTDAGQRTFRVDRITGVEPTGKPAVRSDGFDLDARWQQVVRDVVVRAARVEMLAWMLTGWGERVEVLEPPEVRHALARIGSELVERYAGGVAAGGSSG